MNITVQSYTVNPHDRIIPDPVGTDSAPRIDETARNRPVDSEDRCDLHADRPLRRVQIGETEILLSTRVCGKGEAPCTLFIRWLGS